MHDNLSNNDWVFLAALRSVIAKYSPKPLASVPSNNEKIAYGRIKLGRKSFLYDTARMKDLEDVVESEDPVSMEAMGQVIKYKITFCSIKCLMNEQ